MTISTYPAAILDDPDQAQHVYAYDDLGVLLETIPTGRPDGPVVVWQPHRDPALYLVAEPDADDPDPSLHATLAEALVEAEARALEVNL